MLVGLGWVGCTDARCQMDACKGSRSRGRAGRGEPASLVLKGAGSVIVAVPVLYHIPNYLLPQERERERETEIERKERVCVYMRLRLRLRLRLRERDQGSDRHPGTRCFVIVIVIVIVVVVGACDGP